MAFKRSGVRLPSAPPFDSWRFNRSLMAGPPTVESNGAPSRRPQGAVEGHAFQSTVFIRTNNGEASHAV